MLFNSFQFILFFPLVTVLYYTVPVRWKKTWLLISSYYFYMSWNAAYAMLILTSTLVTFFCGLLIENGRNNKDSGVNKKIILTICLLINFGILFFFKYYLFTLDIIEQIFQAVSINYQFRKLNILLPVGISFYTFQAVGYTIDVYRGDVPAERSFLQYALFVSFFPQLVAGPIERSKNLLKQIATPKNFNYQKFCNGFLIMLWGYFLKLVIADRAAIVVDLVYGDPWTYGGFYLIIATVLFAFQIYCDFYGYSMIATGAAEILGISLMNNFDAPYLAGTVAEFWRRWHISLTSWFKDYLYIPLGGNRKGKIRHYINILIVFAVSGLWHGARLSFVAWGLINGLYQVIGNILRPLRNNLEKALKIDKRTFFYRFFSVITTFVLVDFAWIFFRANGLKNAVFVIQQIVTVHNPWVFSDNSILNLGLNMGNIILLLGAIMVLLVSDCLNYKGIIIRDVILRQDAWGRVIIITFCILVLVVFGQWGNYSSNEFIYFQF